MKPYVYYIEHLSTGTKYIGCKYAASADPATFWQTYFTSSKKVADLRKYFGNDDFKISIRKIFTTKEECLAYETKLLRKIDAANHPDFLNEHNNDNSNVKWTKKKRAKVGSKHKNKIWITDGTVDRRLDFNLPIPAGWWHGSKKKGRPTGKRSDAFCEKMREIALNKPPVTEETRKKQSAWQKGKKKGKLSAERKRKLMVPKGTTVNMQGPKEKSECPHCGKIGGVNVMQRWHFDNCKVKENK